LVSRAIIIVAILIAVVGFLFIGIPAEGVFASVMTGEIDLTRDCGIFWKDRWPTTWWFHCGFMLPYRWLLAACVVALGSALLLKRRRSN
jgi:hypothetical protein